MLDTFNEVISLLQNTKEIYITRGGIPIGIRTITVTGSNIYIEDEPKLEIL